MQTGKNPEQSTTRLDAAQEMKVLLTVFLSLFILLKIAFFREPFMSVAGKTVALFWLFIIPGYTIMLLWMTHFSISERLVIGTGISAATIGIAGYYLGLLGVHAKYHGYLIPAMMIAISVLILWSRQRKRRH